MKNNFKKLLAALTVFAMALALVAVPVASAQAAPTSGTYKTGNTWWGSGSYMVGYAAESGTIQDLETKMGYWPEGGFAWWSAITIDLQSDGTWVVKEVITPSAENNLADVELTTGRLVVMYHEECAKDPGFANAADNLAFFNSLKVGDKLSALGLWGNEVDWTALSKNEDQATFTKIEEEPEVPVHPEHDLVHVEAVEPGCHYEGNIEHWYCLDCETVWQDEALTQVTNHKSVILPALGGEVVHVEAVEPTVTEDGNIEYWYCEECEQVWQDEALTQLTNIKNVVLPATGEVEEPEAPKSGTYKTGNTWWGGGSFMVGYAATSGTIKDAETNGPGGVNYWPEGGFAWWSAIVLEVQENGTWVVTEVIAPSAENNLEGVELTTGRLVVTFHEECLNDALFVNAADNLAFFKSLKVGDTLSALGLWGNELDWTALSKNEDLATFTKIEEVEEPEDPEQPCDHEGVIYFEAVEPACHFMGNVEYWFCPDCEGFWTDEALTQVTNSKRVNLPALGGEVIHMEALAPACHSIGNIEHWYCEECEQVWQDEALTQLTNHKNVILAATGSENIKHVEAVEPTATENGNVEYWYCADCDSYYTDEACTQLSNAKRVILPATGEEAPEKAPQTGDNMPVVLMVSILLASMAIVVYGYKRRNA